MKNALAVTAAITAVAVLLAGFIFLAARARPGAATPPVQYQQAEIPQTGVSEPGGSQGNPPGAIPVQPAALVGLVASLAGALVVAATVIILARKKAT